MRYVSVAGPFGHRQAYYAAGIIAAAVYNSRRTKVDQPMLTPDDFVPKFYESKREVEVRTKSIVDSFVVGLGLGQPPD